MTPTPVPALGFSYEFRISDRRSIVFQTHLDREASLEDINDILDKMQMAATRQQAFIDLVEIENQLTAKRYLLRQEKANYVKAESEVQEKMRLDTRRNPKMAATDKSHLDNLLNSISATQGQIEHFERLHHDLMIVAGRIPAPPANGSAEG